MDATIKIHKTLNFPTTLIEVVSYLEKNKENYLTKI